MAKSADTIISDWECVPRCYEFAAKNELFLTLEHPLKSSVVESKGTRVGSFGSNASSRTSSSISLLGGEALDGSSDPLSQFAKQELADPLSQMATEYEVYHKKSKCREKDELLDDEAPNWNSRRLGILNRFSTSEKLSISTSFLTTGLAAGVTDSIKAQTIVADKVKFRLEQLDVFEDGSLRHMMDLTQQEYIQRIEQLNQELVASWHSDQRVKALKIAIQCSKLLADTTVLQFYPSQFVLITDILDIFGKLVYERLNTKASSGTSSDPAHKAAAEAAQRESAKETCQNWFFKITSIRELLPRLYVEMAIIKCYEFLPPCEYEETLMRLTKIIRGIGDPLVAIYARCYLVRVGQQVSQQKLHIRDNFLDFLSVYPMAFSGATRSELNRQRIDLPGYLSLYGPALDFILSSLMQRNTLYAEEMLQKCRSCRNNGPLLLAILSAYKAEFIAANALEFVQLVNEANTDGVAKGQLYRALGTSACQCAPLPEQRQAFLNGALQALNTLSDPAEFINAIEPWAQFIAEHFAIDEVNTLLGQIAVRMSVGKAYEKHYDKLQSIFDKTLRHCGNIELLLVQDHFLPYLDLFHRESVKIEACKAVLNTFSNHNQKLHTGDAIITNALMYVGKMLNDHVTAHTVDDERRQIAQLISNFVRKVNYGRDFEQQLSFYVEARGAFANLDAVYVTLVHAVNKLAIETQQIVGGRHTRKTAAFVKGCIAYCFITIPSIAAVQQQMNLYLLSGQVALLNLCLGQADACFEAALQLVGELPRSVETDGKVRSLEAYVVGYLCNMLATLVVVPDSPEQGVLYLLRLLLDVLHKFPFEAQSSGPATVYLHALDMLYVQSLEEFPNHIPDVVSNDALYGSDPKFICEINNLCCHVIERFLAQLKALGAAQQLRAQGTLALLLLLRIVRYGDLRNCETFQLAVNLWLLAVKLESHLDAKALARILNAVEDNHRLLKEANAPQALGLSQLLRRIMPGNGVLECK